MSREAFDRFRTAVQADEDAQRRIRDIIDREVFIRSVEALAVEMDFDVEARDLELALQEGHKAWIERWI
jgi:hypothetical protein